MSGQAFFNEQQEQSAVKAEIVAKYFNAWADVMVGNSRRFAVEKIAYIDLFAGPGRYKDGAKSTPLLVLERAIEKGELAKLLIAMFNDADPENASSLQSAIDELPGLDRLRFKPQVFCSEVGNDARAMFEQSRSCPTFSFIDPFGYKGLSRGIVQDVVREWGCDCVFFFNYSRINAGLNNDLVRRHMDALFGGDRVERMRAIVATMKPVEREQFILEELAQALRELGAEFVLPFRFRRPDGSRTSHALVFVTKNILGYEIMKDIMAKASSTEEDGVPSFEYSPADERCPMLFSLNRPLESLTEDLLAEFAGQTLQAHDVYRRHHIGTRYVLRNYKKVLCSLEEAGLVSANPPASKRRMRHGERTLADKTWITFPHP